jgi:FkbM family methyltransferase
MNFSGISEASFLGKVLRWPLRLIPANMRMPILQGRLRGKTWIVGAGTHGYWLGSYESHKQSVFEKYICPGNIVYDIGAHAGYYTLLASTLVGPYGKVFAFEPLPRNIYFLKEHLRINQVKNVQVIESAVSDQSGSARFLVDNSTFAGHLATNGEIEVNKVRLDDLWAQEKLPLPNVVKLDVEGAEFAVLAGGYRLFQAARPVIFLATHGVEMNYRCKEWLQAAGYKLSVLNSSDEILALPDLGG